jgi:hypothetical protein
MCIVLATPIATTHLQFPHVDELFQAADHHLCRHTKLRIWRHRVPVKTQHNNQQDKDVARKDRPVPAATNVEVEGASCRGGGPMMTTMMVMTTEKINNQPQDLDEEAAAS